MILALDHLISVVGLTFGKMTMDWHQIPLNIVSARGPLNGTKSTLDFYPLQFAHAIVKTDAARRLPPWTIVRRTLGFLLEWGSAIRSRNGNLRIDVSEYIDFVGTSLTGRIGQGLGLLYCQHQGYTYLGHYSSVFGHIPRGSSTKKGPDFVLEKRRQGIRALLEAKASAKDRARPPLRQAVDQLRGGFAHLGGRVSEGYATAVVLQDLYAHNDSEGFVIHISNPQTSPLVPQLPTDDSVIRDNYGTWLMFMGLTSLGAPLLRRVRPPNLPPVSVWVLEIARREIAVLPLLPAWWLPEWWLYPDPDWWYWRFWRCFPGSWAVVVAGLDLVNLRRIADAARRGEPLSSDELQEAEAQVQEVDQGVLSIFADTTVLGVLSVSALQNREWWRYERIP